MISVAVILGVIFGVIDYNHVSRGEKPVFSLTLFGTEGKSQYNTNAYFKTRVGILYYFKDQYYDTHVIPLESSPQVKMGIWFFP